MTIQGRKLLDHKLSADPGKSVHVLIVIFGKIVIAASHVRLVAPGKLQQAARTFLFKPSFWRSNALRGSVTRVVIVSANWTWSWATFDIDVMI